jgi:pyruvate kinase
MALVWGSHSVVAADVRSVAEMVSVATEAAAKEGFAQPNEQIVIAAGVPFGSSGTTNLLRVATVGIP